MTLLLALTVEFVRHRIENVVEKGEHFLLFSPCVQKYFSSSSLKLRIFGEGLTLCSKFFNPLPDMPI